MTRHALRTVFACTLGMVVFAAAAPADPNDLTGGVLIAHHCPECPPFSTVPPSGGWCWAYQPHSISALGQVIPEVPWTAFGNTWYVLAAWELEDKTWSGTEFGLGDYDASLYWFLFWEPCFPHQGLEIPTPGWPGPNEGVALLTMMGGMDPPWSGNWVPVYWFGGYSYPPSYGSTVIPIDVDPPTGFCGFSNCSSPHQLFTVYPGQRGAMGVNAPGHVPEWPHGLAWACCLLDPPGACEMLWENDCLAAGGIWFGQGITCQPVNPCPQPGACCVGGFCGILIEENCVLSGGAFQGQGTTCDPNPCEAVCCVYRPTCYCEIMLEAECEAVYGVWHAEWTTCDPNPCGSPSPSIGDTWGRIKSMYR